MRKMIAKVVAVVVLGVFVTGCAGTTPETAPTYSSPLFTSSTPPLVPSDTGFWWYDYGYDAGQRSVAAGTDASCEAGSQALLRSGMLTTDIEVAGYVAGCRDAQSGLPPTYTPPPPLTPAPVIPPPVPKDPCLTGTVGPWVVLWATQSETGDVTVGARCAREAKREARKQIPTGAIFIDWFRI
jgi:hypothetical protein